MSPPIELCFLTPNGEAQPPADEYSVLKRYNDRHETRFQKRRDLAGRLERHVGPHAVLAAWLPGIKSITFVRVYCLGWTYLITATCAA